MIASERWKVLCKNAGRSNLSSTELRQIDEFAEGRKPNQLWWAMKQYFEETFYANVFDFQDWLSKQELPEEVICAAYVSEEPEIIRLADHLETLLGAWFPGPDEEEEIHQVRTRLGKALL